MRSRTIILAAALCVMSTPSRAATPPAPGSAAEDSARAERYGRAIGAAINDTTLAPQAAREVFAAGRPGGEERAAGFLARLARQLGRVTYHHSEISVFRGEGEVRRALHVYLRASDGSWKDLQFFLEPNPPYRATGQVFVAEVTEPVFIPPVGFESPSTIEWLDGFVDRQARDYDLSGAALVAFGDSIVFERYFGTEDVARRRPITANTRFSLGSGNKMMTAIAVARLVNAGQLSYDDPVAKYFPDFPDAERAKQITIHHLLSHQSGWGEIWTDEWARVAGSFTRLEQHLPYVYQVGPLGQVGERHYCNSNYLLLGLIIERVTGEDYLDHMERTLTRPLGLERTGSRGVDSVGAGFSERMTGKARAWRRAATGRQGTSMGGGHSTSRDMLRFARALAQGRVVDRATLETLTEPKRPEIGGGEPYGYGFTPLKHGMVTSYGHGGIASGVNFELRIFPEEDITVLVFSNQDNGAYDDLKTVLLRLASGER